MVDNHAFEPRTRSRWERGVYAAAEALRQGWGDYSDIGEGLGKLPVPLGPAPLPNLDAGAPGFGSALSYDRRRIVVRPLVDCRLYTFVDTAYLLGRNPVELARQLCAGGSDVIQLRAKDRPEEEIARLASAIHEITQPAGVWLVINDYPKIALEIGCNFFHLGQEDFFDTGKVNRGQLFSEPCPFQFGLSSHAPEQAKRAVAAGADYIAIGPVFRTATKPSAHPATLSYVTWAKDHIEIPWFAIGGITLGNLDAVIEHGARRVCVVSAILNAPDVAKACQLFKNRLGSVPILP